MRRPRLFTAAGREDLARGFKFAVYFGFAFCLIGTILWIVWRVFIAS